MNSTTKQGYRQTLRTQIDTEITRVTQARSRVAHLLPKGYFDKAPNYALVNSTTIMCFVLATITSILIRGWQMPQRRLQFSHQLLGELLFILDFMRPILITWFLVWLFYCRLAKPRRIFCTKHALKKVSKLRERTEFEEKTTYEAFKKIEPTWQGFLAWQDFLKRSRLGKLELMPMEAPLTWAAVLHYYSVDGRELHVGYLLDKEGSTYDNFVRMIIHLNQQEKIPDEAVADFESKIIGSKA